MLLVDHPSRPLPRWLMDRPGAFLWWYVDALDAHGNGFVCIWSWGLPFLPGRASAARAGTPDPTDTAPSVNLAIYRGGRQVAYHLLRVDPADATWSDAGWRMGPCAFTPVPGGVRGELRLPVPGSDIALTGTFEVTGPPSAYADTPDPGDGHRWTPLLGPARATATFRHGDRPVLDCAGTGYHDRNGCPVPLDALGLDHWIWGRLTRDDGAGLLVFYLSFPTDPAASPFLLVARADAEGRFRFDEVPLSLGPQRRAWFGMPWWETVTLKLPEGAVTVRFDPPVDDGPFYLRTRISGPVAGAPAAGWAELCRPDRVDGPWMRPLVSMCVQPGSAPGSLWLPLFTGPSEGRWSRLVRWWTGARRAPGAP